MVITSMFLAAFADELVKVSEKKEYTGMFSGPLREIEETARRRGTSYEGAVKRLRTPQAKRLQPARAAAKATVLKPAFGRPSPL